LEVEKGKAHDVRMEFKAVALDVKTRGCMDMMECLEVFGDGSDAAFAVRNVNKLQLDCVEDKTLKDKAERKKCKKWKKCLQKGGHLEILKTILQVALGTGGLLQVDGDSSSQGRRRSQSQEAICMDPEVDDLESLECNCLEKAQEECEDGEDMDTCLKRYSCKAKGICCKWKRDHCDGFTIEHCDGSMIQQSREFDADAGAANNSLQREESRAWALASARQRSAVDKGSDRLDATLGSKCT